MKTILITGVSRGLGRALTEEFIREHRRKVKGKDKDKASSRA